MNSARPRSRIASRRCVDAAHRRSHQVDSLADALIIGAGPAGCASAIFLAQAGWQVILVEQNVYPRQKVCGECISAGSLDLFDALGVGAAFRDMAGPELSRVGWMGSLPLLAADFPACSEGAYPYGRAVGRDRLDALLLDRARSIGVEVLQPAKVRSVRGGPNDFSADIEMRFSAKIACRAHFKRPRGPPCARGDRCAWILGARAVHRREPRRRDCSRRGTEASIGSVCLQGELR